MEFQPGQWIIDQLHKKPLWITTIALEGTFFMGYVVNNHNAMWFSTSIRNKPRLLTDQEVADFLASEMDIDGMTFFKTIMNNPDDYLFKNITRYGIDSSAEIGAAIEREIITRRLPPPREYKKRIRRFKYS